MSELRIIITCHYSGGCGVCVGVCGAGLHGGGGSGVTHNVWVLCVHLHFFSWVNKHR